MKFTFWLLNTFFILKLSNAFSFGNTFNFLTPQKTQSFSLKLVSDDLDNLELNNKYQNLENLDKLSTNKLKHSGNLDKTTNKLKWPNARFMRTFLRSNSNVNNSKNPTHLILGYNELPKKELEKPIKKDDNTVDWNKILNDLNQATDFKSNFNENLLRKNVSNSSKFDKKEEDETMNNFFNYWSTFFSSGNKENVTNIEKEKAKKKVENTNFFYLNNNNLAKKLIEVIICDKTLAIIDVKYKNSNNRIVKDCALFDLEKREKEANEIVKKMNLNKISVNFVTMMDIINQCKPFSQPINSILDLESNRNLSLSSLKIKKTINAKNLNQTASNNSSINLETSGYSFVTTGIVTGTLWCGVGDLAKSYYDLGPKKQLDICCRAHDHCPIRLKGFHHGYGLFNFGISTKSHCQCDKDFHDCLKNINDNLSNTIGNIYFNSLKNKCIDEYCYPTEKDGKLECLKDGSMYFSQPEPF